VGNYTIEWEKTRQRALKAAKRGVGGLIIPFGITTGTLWNTVEVIIFLSQRLKLSFHLIVPASRSNASPLLVVPFHSTYCVHCSRSVVTPFILSEEENKKSYNIKYTYTP